ncbi:MAG: hypothetical protein KKB51_03590 [Candidatus Riflebacteria bacterium]|nr:hypothetical protein [Candidatus Riflebacteria bacterium]
MKKILTILTIMMVIATLGFAATIKLEPAKQRKLNVFFSNFSEANVESFAQGALSDQAMLDFALRHLYINKFKSLKKSKDGCSVIATTEQVDTATMKYFGQKVKQHKESSYTIPCADGEVFYFSQLDSLEDIGNKAFKATGTIYSNGPDGIPDVHGTPADWKETEEDVSVASKFSALIKSEGERYILVEYSLVDAASDESQAVVTPEPATEVQSPAKINDEDLKSLLMKDVFDWQMLDEKGKIALVKQIKKVWRADGYETDANAIDAKTLCDKMILGDQANVFESACKAAEISMDPYWPIYNSQE